MSYTNNKWCQVNLLCAILSEQMITVLGQAVCGWTSWTLTSVFVSGDTKTSNTSSELWMKWGWLEAIGPLGTNTSFFLNGKFKLRKLFESPCSVLHTVWMDQETQQNTYSETKRHWVSSPTFDHKYNLQCMPYSNATLQILPWVMLNLVI